MSPEVIVCAQCGTPFVAVWDLVENEWAISCDCKHFSPEHFDEWVPDLTGEDRLLS